MKKYGRRDRQEKALENAKMYEKFYVNSLEDNSILESIRDRYVDKLEKVRVTITNTKRNISHG